MIEMAMAPSNQQTNFSFEHPVTVEFRHRLLFTRGAFRPDNAAFADAMRERGMGATSIAVVIDSGVAEAWPNLGESVAAYCRHHAEALELRMAPLILAGGERVKNGQDYEEVLRLINDAKLCRHSALVAIGGGAVLDAAGYAAAIAHRGIRLVRFPTTTVSQDDSGVGVKNGINAFGKKNYLGTFSVPHAVICDEEFLATLSDRDWSAGFSEAVKVALLKDPDFFNQIEAAAPAIAARNMGAAMPIIRRSAELHLNHIATGGDPFEFTTVRPLDFGHWAAHKLEQLSDFEVSHGEAVGIGIALDVAYCAEIGLLDSDSASRIHRCLAALKLPLSHSLLKSERLLEGIEEFREHLGGELTLSMLSTIGSEHVIHEVDHNAMRRAVANVLNLDAAPKGLSR